MLSHSRWWVLFLALLVYGINQTQYWMHGLSMSLWKAWQCLILIHVFHICRVKTWLGVLCWTNRPSYLWGCHSFKGTIIQCYLFSNLSQVRDGEGYPVMLILRSNILLTMLLVLSFLFLWISGRERDHNEGSWSDRVISRNNIWLDYELGQVTQIPVIVIQTSNSQFHDVVLLPILIYTHFCCLIDSFQSSESYSKIWWCMFISPDGML